MPNQQFQTIFALKTRFKNPTLALQILCLVGWRNTLEIASAMSRLLDYCLIPSALSTSRAITVAKGGLISEDNRGATTGKVPKAWALPRFWVSIHSYKKQPVKKIWVRILGLAWLKFAVAPLDNIMSVRSSIR